MTTKLNTSSPTWDNLCLFARENDLTIFTFNEDESPSTFNPLSTLIRVDYNKTRRTVRAFTIPSKHSLKKSSWGNKITASILISAIIIAAFAFGYLVAQDVPTHDIPTSFQL